VVAGLCGGPAPATNSLGVPGCAGAPAATRGQYRFTVVQERVPIDISYTVVGPPRHIKFQVFESSVSAGILDAPAGCPLATDLAGFTAALGRAEKTVVIARVSDSSDQDITSAWVDWKTADPDIGVFATDLTPTLNLGGFGFGAPNVFCGTKGPGTVKMTISILTGPDSSAAVWSPSASLDSSSQDETVLGVPAAVTLSVTPASLACDGTATAEVAATVTDSAGQNVADGTNVKFSVQVLGTANPIDAKTTSGVAKTTVTPLSSAGRGVPVVVSAGVGVPVVFSTQNSILIACALTGAGPTAISGGGTTGSVGTISSPNTGSGGYVREERRDVLGWWPALGLALAAMIVTAGVLRARGRR
jgi:hypothetical protein